MSSNKTSVLIAGSGSAGLSAALWLSIHKIPYRILDSRAGPLEKGQADGVQCRTVEIFESFGLVDPLLREAYWVNEVVFWNAGESEGGTGIVKTRSAPDTARGLSRQPHVILNQARINALLLGAMRMHNGQEVEYGKKVTGVAVDSTSAPDPEAYPVTATVEWSNGEKEAIQARYVLVSRQPPPPSTRLAEMRLTRRCVKGSDGAHSLIRKSLSIPMLGDSTSALWGVMDIYPLTNFPDIRKKSIIHSAHGAILTIPREGGSLVRFYVELPSSQAPKSVTLEQLQDASRKAFAPYEMDFSDTYWWSAYYIGQRLAERFVEQDRVFLAGDACHTHSPKAGQGMNVSLQDGYNIGWKLAHVLRGLSPPSLLETYALERYQVARTLIDFDRAWTRQMSAGKTRTEDGTEEDFSETFVKAGRYTAGLTATYDDSPITSAENSSQNLAPGLVVGMRFPSTQVVRFCDVKPMQLANALPSDGRWRIVIFAGDLAKRGSIARLEKLGKYLYSHPTAPIPHFTPPDADIDSVIEAIIILSGDRLKTDQEDIPECFTPKTGKWGMRDLHKIHMDAGSYNHGHGHAYEFYGINEQEGAVVMVRPDQSVSMVLEINDHAAIGKFLAGFLLPQRS
ncbi:thioredoxin-like protein [Amylocarpus encephaloides]|uniref:Thioredoxin-like protein n=1 Tax=Amylocarpus encephaloides TaxID=45428 RepID=A0A9P7YEW4_9HELO|nr:thioredoxin-like protein [Amylocarpus encephaloides]